jgi:hypothetical protein
MCSPIGTADRAHVNAEADAGADEHPPAEQHREVGRRAAEASADNVRGRRGEHGPFPAEVAAQWAGEERRGRGRQEERGAEQSQELAIELAVLVHDHLFLHLVVDGREELDQEGFRRRQTGFMIATQAKIETSIIRASCFWLGRERENIHPHR